MRLSKSVVETAAAALEAIADEFVGELSMPALFRSVDSVIGVGVIVMVDGAAADDVDIDFCI